MLTRKQIWRRIANPYNSYTQSSFEKKRKVHFSNIVVTRLIPTKDEMNRLYLYYIAYEES